MTRTTHPRWGLAVGALLLAGTIGTTAQAQEAQDAAAAQEEIDRTPEDCVVMNRIARNIAADNRQVVFFMRGNKHYLNVLDGACQSLSAGDTRLVFHAKNTGSAKLARLCDTDSFTVDRQTSRIGCSLGVFNPITAAEAAALTGQPLPEASASNSDDDDRGSRRSRRDRD